MIVCEFVVSMSTRVCCGELKFRALIDAVGSDDRASKLKSL